MISFKCPHCGNAFRVSEKHAGQDGWCRMCKRLVVVPDPEGKFPSWGEMSVEERCRRLDAKLQYAAGQADQFKYLLAKYCESFTELLTGKKIRIHRVNERLFSVCFGAVAREVRRLRAELEEERKRGGRPNDSRVKEMEEVLGTARNEMDAARRDSDAARTELNGVLAEIDVERSRAEERRDASNAAQDKLLRALEEAGEKLQVAVAERENVLRRVKLLDQELGGSRTELDAAQFERDSLQARLDEDSRRATKIQGRLVAAEAERDAARDTLGQRSSELSTLRESLKASSAAATNSGAQSDVAVAQLQALVNATEQRNVGLERTVHSLNVDVDRLRGELASLQADSQRLEATAKSERELRIANRRLEDELQLAAVNRGELSGRAESLELELAARTDEVVRLDDQMLRLRRETKELRELLQSSDSDASALLANMEGRIQAAEVEREVLRLERAALQTELNIFWAERGVLDERPEAIQPSVSESLSTVAPPPDSAEIAELRQRIVDLESERGTLVGELETLRAKLSESKGPLAPNDLSFLSRDGGPFGEDEDLDSSVVWSAEVEGIDEIQNEDPIVKSYMRFLGER